MSVKWGARSSSADCKQRKSVTCSRPRLIWLQPHRHHDVARAGIAGGSNQAAAVAVGESELDILAIDGGERIEQVIHIESHFEIVAFIPHLDLFLGFFLLGIVGL